MIKKGLVNRVRKNELTPKTLVDILIISTACKATDDAITETMDKDYSGLDLWDSVEATIVFGMKEMQLDDLINLLWAAKELGKGSPNFLNELEKNLTRLILKVKDDEFQTLLTCFA